MSIRFCPVCIAIVTAVSSAASADDFRPQFDQATLKMGDQTYRHLRVESPWYSEIRIGGMRYRVEGDTVVQADGETRKVVARARSPDGATLRWKGAAQNVAFLVEHIHAGMSVRQRAGEPVVRRLDLMTMDWLPPLEAALKPPAESKSVKAREAAAVKAWDEYKNKYERNPKPGRIIGRPERGTGICDVLVVESGTFMLSYVNLSVQGLMGLATLGFELSFIPAGTDKSAWRRWIDFPENPQETSPLSGSPSVAFTSDLPAVDRLTWTKAGVVVCLPFTHELLCINGSGEEEWRLPRIWEFERWNTGPSSGMWGIDRFGLDVNEGVTAVAREGIDPKVAEAERKASQDEIDKEVEKLKATLAERSERFYKDYKVWIVAGPTRVPPVDDERGEVDLFFAIAKTRYPYNLVAAPECTIYQVSSEGGWVKAMTTIPRVVYPRPHIGIPGGSVWSCEGGSLVRIGSDPSHEEQCPVEWYREYPGLVPWDDWDHEGPGASTKVCCATAEMLFRAGFKCDRHDADKLLSFRINVVDLETGLARDMTLSLPFEGKIPAHEQEAAGDPGCMQGFAPPEFRIAIELLEIDGDVLHVVIQTGKLRTAVDFDVKALLKTSDPK